MMGLWEEAEKVYFLGIEVYAFGLYCALGAAMTLIMLFLQCKREKMKPGTVPLTGVLSLVCGFVCSRLLFCLLDQTISEGMPLQGVLMVAGGGYSMMGALLGGLLGAMLAGRITRQSSWKMADLMAPALLLFVAGERIGEGYILDFGVSRPLVGDFFKGTFLAVEGDYDWYLATYLLESFSALILSVILLRDSAHQKRQGDTLVLFLILFGGVQTLMESLRYDRHMSFSFVGIQHVMAMAMLGIALIVLAIRCWKEKKALAILALISIPLVAGLGIGLEFAIDRTTVNRYLLYAAYILLLALPMWLGVRLRKEA